MNLLAVLFIGYISVRLCQRILKKNITYRHYVVVALSRMSPFARRNNYLNVKTKNLVKIVTKNVVDQINCG